MYTYIYIQIYTYIYIYISMCICIYIYINPFMYNIYIYIHTYKRYTYTLYEASFFFANDHECRFAGKTIEAGLDVVRLPGSQLYPPWLSQLHRQRLHCFRWMDVASDYVKPANVGIAMPVTTHF